MDRRRLALVTLLFLLSGGTALVYQVAWTRSLGLIFGASHQAVSIVLGSFMGGLALGGFVLGRLTPRMSRPLRVYGLLELAVGVFALLSPALLSALNQLYVAAAGALGEVNWQLNLMRVGLALGVLVVPTFFMGGTLPVLTHYLVHQQRELGVRLAWLYGINTVGAVLGALAATFVLLPMLGVWHTQVAAAAVNGLIAIIAVLADRSAAGSAGVSTAAPGGMGVSPAVRGGTGVSPVTPGGMGVSPAVRGGTGVSPVTSHAAEAAERPANRYALALRLTFWGTAVSGLCALALEVLWTRAISVAAGTSTYSFTVMLAAFLIGISLGSGLHALLPLRRVHESVQFGVVLVLIGVSSAVATQTIPELPQRSIELNAWLYRGVAGVGRITTLLLSFSIMLVPCVLMGVAFPLAGQARARLRECFGRSVGDVVGLNTLGCIAGSLLAGFVLLPALGLQRGMLAVSALNAGYGLLVLAAAAAGRFPKAAPIAIVAVLALIGGGGAALHHAPRWDPRRLGAFCNNLMASYAGQAGPVVERAMADLGVLYYHEGRGTILSVVENAGTRVFIVMGKAEASDSHTDLQHERLLGHLPALLHPDPRSAAVIGLGAGITLGGVAAHERIEKITLVEIEPGVVGAARQFSDVNGDALSDPRVRVVFQDGRNYLLTTRERFDVITADPIHPWAAGSAYLYTVEYYRTVASRLNEGGIACQWLPLYELSEANVRSAVASFAAAFAHVTVWQTALDAVLIGSNRPVRIDPENLARRLAEPRVAVEMQAIGLGDPLSFLAELALDEPATRAFAAGARLNTDDNLYLEFSAPLSIGTPQLARNVRLLDSLRISPRSLLLRLAPLLDDEAAAQQTFARYRKAKSRTVEAQTVLHDTARDNSGQAARAMADSLRSTVADAPEYGRARSLLAEALHRLGIAALRGGRYAEAVEVLREAVSADPWNPEAHWRLGVALHEAGRDAEAIPVLEAGLRLRPRHVPMTNDYAVALIAVGRGDEGLKLLQRCAELRPQSASARYALAVGLTRAGQLEAAVGEYHAALRLDATLVDAYNNCGRALAGLRRYGEAIEMLRQGFGQKSDDARLAINLGWLLLTAPDPQLRNPAEALDLGQRANLMLGGSAPAALDLQAAALVQSGRAADGVALARKALDAAEAQQNATLAESLRKRIAEYEKQAGGR
ncbi:Spermidine synthase [Phycisphaerae bacterium RAS1]|nr:Spermidine synthase [Phycisphaerae bacterium RAS1]